MTTFSIRTLSILHSHNGTQHNNKQNVNLSQMLSVAIKPFIPSVVMLNAVMLSGMALFRLTLYSPLVKL
jgi:hypothetical protein